MLFGKNAQQRVADTIQFVQNGVTPAYISGPIRNDIANWLAATFPRLTPADLTAYDQLSSDMSVKSQIGAGVAKGTSADRSKRRAIFLLWKAIGQAQSNQPSVTAAAGAAMTTAAAGLDALLEQVLVRAAVVASAAGARAVLDDLIAHPARFLRANRIIVRGSSAGQARFEAAGGPYQNVHDFYFQYEANLDRFVFGTVAAALNGQSRRVSSVSVVAVHWSRVPNVGAAPGNFTGVLGCELAGADFMVTTQFTGCAFCWTSHGGVLRASHISPAGGLPPNAVPANYNGGGQALAGRLMVAGVGTMANAGNTPLTVFGTGAGNAVTPGGGNGFYPASAGVRWVSIIGVNKALAAGGNSWRLYTQAIDHGDNIMAAEARRIL